MSRTYRRRGERHEYHWVLREFVFESGCLMRVPIDRGSPEGRRAIARFHSDAEATMKGGVPHWFRRIFKRRRRVSMAVFERFRATLLRRRPASLAA